MQAQFLADGRLHLQHGPIDLIIQAWGAGAQTAYKMACVRFETLLEELSGELALLRAPLGVAKPKGTVAQRMVSAIGPHKGVFVTPMAAVAGAVADEICEGICTSPDLTKAYVNNGGDIAVYLTPGQSLRAAIHNHGDSGRVDFRHADPARGLATSGWRGRSHSLGIADAVTVVAKNAAQADVAATLIANAVDLPGNTAISRQPACDLAPDSDLGGQLVTTAVGGLGGEGGRIALQAGKCVADAMLARGLIHGAVLFLQGQSLLVGAAPQLGPRNAAQP